MLGQLSYLFVVLTLVAQAAGLPIVSAAAPQACSPGQMCEQLYLPVTLGSPVSVSPKKGVAAVMHDYTIDCADFPKLGVTWLYHWWPQPLTCPGVESIPMYADVNQLNNITLGGNSKWIMGFNEPDSRYQSNLTPEQAVEPWHRLEAAAAGKWLVSPSVVVDENWLPAFRNAYFARYGVYPRFDALGVHCYWNSADLCIDWVEKFIAYADQWGAWNGVWLNEYHIAPSAPDSVAQADRLTRWLECEPRVSRYAWFTHRSDVGEYCVGGCAPLYQWGTSYLTDWGIKYSTVGQTNRCR